MKATPLALALVLAGCVGGQTYEDSPKFRTCKYQATAATTGGTLYGAKGVIDGAYAEAIAYRQILDACMAQY